jgi:hypothetical protein
MNKLSEQEIDKELMDRDERKPVRKIVDDYVAPAATVVAGGAAAVAGAVTHLQTVDKRKTIE